MFGTKKRGIHIVGDMRLTLTRTQGAESALAIGTEIVLVQVLEEKNHRSSLHCLDGSLRHVSVQSFGTVRSWFAKTGDEEFNIHADDYILKILVKKENLNSFYLALCHEAMRAAKRIRDFGGFM